MSTDPNPPEWWRAYDAIEARLTAFVSERMLDLAGLAPGMRVLDLASGRGEPAIRAAKRVAPGGHVLGVDPSDAALALGRANAEAEGVTNLELRAGSAESLDVADASFDVATARWGLMYMQSPVAALSEVRRALVPGGRLVAAFWAEPERVAWSTLPRSTVSRHAPWPEVLPDTPDVSRYGQLPTIERDLTAAGFAVTHVEELDVPVIEAPDGAGIAEWARALGYHRKVGLDDAATEAWTRELAAEAERHREDDLVRLRGITRLVVAQ